MEKSKQAKTPQVTKNTKLLCFDIESNGLHGEAFAVAAVLMNSSGEILEKFTGRTNIIGTVDAWVKNNVLPAIENIPITHKSYKDLRESFWKWYLDTEPKCDYVLVSNGYPVEYNFLQKCQQENLQERYWQHPFPILDLFSLLLMISDKPTSKNKLLATLEKQKGFIPHNPLDDSIAAGMAAFEAFRTAGKLE